jgi:hypothetical protein
MRRSEFCQSRGLSFSLWIAIEEATLERRVSTTLRHMIPEFTEV